MIYAEKAKSFFSRGSLRDIVLELRSVSVSSCTPFHAVESAVARLQVGKEIDEAKEYYLRKRTAQSVEA